MPLPITVTRDQFVAETLRGGPTAYTGWQNLAVFVFLITFANSGCAAWTQSSDSTWTNKKTKQIMSSQPPSSSRPAPPKVEPIVHKGVRYEQDMQSSKNGGTQPGGYMVAVDPATGERLWMLKVYEVPVQAGAPLQPGRYFRSMRLDAQRDQIDIESEVGGKYLVDLATRESTWISGPDSVHQKELRK